MTFDAVQIDRDLRRRREPRPFGWFRWLVLAALTAFSLYVYLWEFSNVQSDLFKHAVIASQFNFGDPHSITSRLAYPLWHLFVAALFQLGVPLDWAAAGMCALCKALLFVLVCRYVWIMADGRLSAAAATAIGLPLMFITPICIPGINPDVYRGVGSPTVWHNPTQLAVLVTAMLCVPYALHCWYDFENRLPQTGAQTTLPWRKVFTLAVLLVLSLACKPTFMQAFIPAAAAFFLIQWIRHPKNSRYFFQIILAFLPAVAYFLLQYLYYTGVVVPYTSGVEFGATWGEAWDALRNMLMMAAFPLFALLCCRKKGLFRDAGLTLTLWMAFFSILEATFFRETGLRLNHGNFNWASMSTAFMLWIVVTPKFVTAIAEYHADQAKLTCTVQEGAPSSAVLQKNHFWMSVRSALFLLAFILLIWHLYSGGYYLYYLFTTGSTF